MRQFIITILVVLCGSAGLFSADQPAHEASISTEAGLRRQVEELTILLKHSREIAQGLTSRIAVMDSERDANAVAIDLLREINPNAVKALEDLAKIELQVDSFPDIIKLRNLSDGSSEALETLRKARNRHLNAIDTWVKGQDNLKKALAKPE